MATTTATMSRQPLSERPLKRKKEQRTDIWSSLLRQTREAQARSRTQAVQYRSLILCGGSPDDQRSFAQTLSRPPPAQPPTRNPERKQQRSRGELRLSNKYAFGYGHVTLYSPPQQSGTGVQVLGAEAEETARVEVHTVPEAKEEYVAVLRTLLKGKTSADVENLTEDLIEGEEPQNNVEDKPPGICLLLSWKEPWKFLDQVRRWIQIIAKALLQAGVPATDPMDIIKDAKLAITIVVQHTEAQEELFREGYKEEDFDYISQCLRTVLLPLHPFSALVYSASSAPPQQPGSPLSEAQKVVYASLGLDLSALSPKQPRSGDTAKKDDFGPKHEFMDRMAIIIPAGWDSVAFIRTLSETFSPEDMLGSWLSDIQPPPEPKVKVQPQSEDGPTADTNEVKQTNGGAEVYESSPVDEMANDDISERPVSPSKLAPSAVRTFESKILDPQAHKVQRSPQIEVTTKLDQNFLGEMRAQLQQLESQDRDRESTTRSSTSHTGRIVGMPTGEQTGALTDLGDVSFNVGGVSYDTVSAEAAIERLKRPPTMSQSPLSPTSRTSTPKPPRLNRELTDEGRSFADRSTPSGAPSSTSTKSSDAKDLPIDKLDEYFRSLMRGGAGGGGSSRDNTPTKSK